MAAHRDELEAARARIEALERELSDAREEIERFKTGKKKPPTSSTIVVPASETRTADDQSPGAAVPMWRRVTQGARGFVVMTFGWVLLIGVAIAEIFWFLITMGGGD